MGLETTLRFVRSSLRMDAAAYSNTIAGFIYLQPTQPVLTIRGAFPGYRYTQTNARLRGLELSSSWTPTRHVEITTNGTLVRGTDRTNGGPLFDMPADRVTVAARVTGSRTRVGSWFLGAGSQLVRRQDGVPAGTVYTLPTAGYALLQLEAGSTRVMLGSYHVDVSLSMNNALDTRYRDYLSRYRLFVNDAGRDVVARVTMPF
jgi:iron complex outermembrane recepter protein